MSARPAVLLRELLLQRSDLEAASDVKITVGDIGDLAFAVPGPNQLVVNPQTLSGPEAVTALLHGLELAWLRGLAPDRQAVCGVLAARVATLHRALELGVKFDAGADKYLRAQTPNPGTAQALWHTLAAYQNAGRELTPADFETIAACWPYAGPTEFFMTSDIDPRLWVDPMSGMNRYGCKPRPQPNVVTFSSCTASSISARGYVSAEASRRRILGGILTGTMTCATEAQRLGAEILAHFGVADLAEIVLAPSGTDATRLITDMIRAVEPNAPLTAILVGLSETGNAIPEAATGRNFTDAQPSHPLGGDIKLISVGLRDGTGHARAAADVEAEIANAVAAAEQVGCVALHPVDLSKTGLLAPRPDFVARLARQYGPKLHVAVDSCQARLGTEQVRQYLSEGHAVVITGSKFYTGPPFSGAVIFPRGKYRASDAAPDAGTLVRWAASTGEMRAFQEVPPEDRAKLLRRFGERVRGRIAGNPRLVEFPNPPLLRPRADGWDAQQTIFVFAVRDPKAPDRLLDFDTLAAIQRWLYSDLSERFSARVAARVCRLGQPVRLGEDRATAIGALRIASGARVVSGEPSHVLLRGETHIDREIADMDDIMAKLDLILDHLPELMGRR
jgi:hypothetical protein